MTDIIKISGNWHKSAIPTGDNAYQDMIKKALEVCELINNAKSICDDNQYLHDLFENAYLDLDIIENDLYENLIDKK